MKRLTGKFQALIVAAAVLGTVAILSHERNQAPQIDQVAVRFLEVAIPSAQAATPNLPVSSPGVMLVPLQFAGTYTASTSTPGTFKMPMPCNMLGVGGVMRTSSGTTPTLTIDVQAAGVSILSAPFSASTTWAEGTIATAAIADEATITVDFAIDGAGATINDVTVLLTCARK